MNLLRRLVCFCVVCSALSCFGSAQAQELKVSAPQSGGFSDLWGKVTTPDRFGDRAATVYLFIVRDCPIANAYAPEFNRIVGDYAIKRVGFYLIYVDADTSIGEMRQHYKEYGYKCGALNDFDRRLVKRWKAQRTPEAVVVDRAGKVIYQGRIDDRYVDFGKAKHLPTRRDLRLVLDALTEGRAIASTTTPVIGCPVPE